MKVICSIFVMLLSTAVFAQPIHAVGRFESFSFEFQSKNPLELSRDCISFALNERIAHIDDIYVSFNGHKRMHLHNRDDMWHYPRHFCRELEKIAKTIDLTPPTPNEFREVEALIHNRLYSFSGAHQAEIFNECISQLENNIVRETDYIRARLVDRGWNTVRNNDSWWRGAQQICTIIDQAIFQPRVNLHDNR